MTGEQEQQAETGAFLGRAMLISLGLIFLILVTQFNSLSKPVIILSEIIFSIIGVLLGFSIFKMDMSILMTGIGIVALAGIVVRNGILLVEFTDILIDNGMELKEAIIEAGRTRMTPVILTASATILGLVPLAVGLNIDFVTLFTHGNPHIYFGGDIPTVLTGKITNLEEDMIEVKTTDGGAGRFHDQQVRPSSGYQQAVNDFLKTFDETLTASKLKTSTGVSISQLVALKDALPVEQRDLFKEKLTNAISNIFVALPDAAGPIVDAIMVGNDGLAKQRYSVAALNNYMAAKTEDKGILVINLRKDPYTFVFFNDNKSLNAGGMRLHAGTIYPITNDVRYAYPQTDIVDTSQAQDTAGSTVVPVAKAPKVAKPKVAPAATPATKLVKPTPLTPGIQNQQATMSASKVPMGQPPASDL
jgi:hypothetical protein